MLCIVGKIEKTVMLTHLTVAILNEKGKLLNLMFWELGRFTCLCNSVIMLLTNTNVK